MLAKIIAVKAAQEDMGSIPTLVVNQRLSGDMFSAFLQSIRQPMIVLFDEFDKAIGSCPASCLLLRNYSRRCQQYAGLEQGVGLSNRWPETYLLEAISQSPETAQDLFWNRQGDNQMPLQVYVWWLRIHWAR